MAYLITADEDKTKLYRIAANDTAKDNLNLAKQNVAHTISDSEFNNLRNNTKFLSGHNGTNFTFSDMGHEFLNESILKDYLADVSKVVGNAINNYPNHPDNNAWSTYKTLIDSYATSSLTYPLNKSWEQHCEANSITYFNLLQLP